MLLDHHHFSGQQDSFNLCRLQFRTARQLSIRLCRGKYHSYFFNKLQIARLSSLVKLIIGCNLKIRDNSASGALLARYCGSQVPDIIDSPSNRLWIKFRADQSVSGRGFHAFYTSSKWSLYNAPTNEFSYILFLL